MAKRTNDAGTSAYRGGKGKVPAGHQPSMATRIRSERAKEAAKNRKLKLAKPEPKTVTLEYDVQLRVSIPVELPPGKTAEELVEALNDGEAFYNHDDTELHWGKLTLPVDLKGSSFDEEDMSGWEEV